MRFSRLVNRSYMKFPQSTIYQTNDDLFQAIILKFRADGLSIFSPGGLRARPDVDTRTWCASEQKGGHDDLQQPTNPG
jgi:hypothetical protein